MQEERFTVDYKQQVYDVSAFIQKRSKTWIMCLHCIQSNKLLFNDLLAQPFFDDYSIVAPDFIGFGNSLKPEDFSYDIQDQAKICSLLAKQLGIEQVFLIGHSLGGMVATLLLLELGDMVQGIVNLEGNFVSEDAGASREIANQSFEEFRNGGYEHLKSSIAGSNEVSAPLRLQWLESTPDYAIYKTAQSIIQWSEKGSLLKLLTDNTPVKKLYIYGEQNADKAACLPSEIPKIGIPNSGHFMLLDQPDETFNAIESFLVAA